MNDFVDKILKITGDAHVERTNERAIWSRRKENGNVKTPSASWRGKVVPAEMHHCASSVASCGYYRDNITVQHKMPN